MISTSLREDLITLDDSLAELVDRGAVAFETAYPLFEDIEKRASLQRRTYRIAPLPETAGTAGPGGRKS